MKKVWNVPEVVSIEVNSTSVGVIPSFSPDGNWMGIEEEEGS